MPELQKLFVAVNETEHVYTWDYSKQESASQLFDVGGDSFALITTCHEVDEETGAMLDLRIRDFARCYLYSKHTLRVTETFNIRKLTDALPEMEKRLSGSQVRLTEAIQLPRGRVYISEGDLVLVDESLTA